MSRSRYEDPAGSNVVEAVIRSLRRKLESRTGAIETIRGLGYRVNTHALAQTSEHGDG
jgi:DNA-binding response OmpR family regulator